MSIDSNKNKLLFYRLVGLWAICEGMIGGTIHALKLPITGLVVGACSIICISLIAYYLPQKKFIVQATLLVAIFKFILSPYSPFAAYLAVFFQGFVGSLLFYNTKYFKTKCLLLAVITFSESAIQRIIIMVIIYGTQLWKAIDLFIQSFTNATSVTPYSIIITYLYLLFHVFVGIIVGIFIGKLPQYFESKEAKNLLFTIDAKIDLQNLDKLATNQNKPVKPLKLITWIILGILFICSFFIEINQKSLQFIILQIFIRSFFILLTWNILINPILNKKFNTWLLNKKEQSNTEIHEIQKVMPTLQYIITRSWEVSSSKSSVNRLSLFCKTLFVNVLFLNETQE